MAYNTKEVLKDVDGNPISQYYNPDTDSYEPVEGSSGGNKVVVENNDLSLIPILDKLSQLTGTVIDEETRKSNEAQRIVNEDIRESNETARINSESTESIMKILGKHKKLIELMPSLVELPESGRVSAENTRVSNEDIRKSNEIARNLPRLLESNEDDRQSNESSRQSSETIRNTNEDARIDNEDIRESNEADRISNELARESNEGIRESQELERVSAESDRVSAEISRENAESTRVSQENTRQSQESIRESNEVIRESQESIRESNEDLRIALYNDLQSKLASGFFKGEKGDTGNGLEYTWNGTQLGVRVEGTTEYVFVDLKGEKGDTGDIANLTSNHVTTALGYSPVSPTQLNDKVKTDVPLNAKFTDTTYAEITTAEIDTGTASTLRTITGRRVKYILDKVQGWIGGLTKSDVGLGNVDNIKQMPISGGVLENYREKLVTVSAANGSINLSLGNVFQHSPSGNTTYSITNASGQAHSFTLIINMGATVRTLTFPASVKWQGGEIPDLTTGNKIYVLTFVTVNGGTTWLGMFGGEF